MPKVETVVFGETFAEDVVCSSLVVVITQADQKNSPNTGDKIFGMKIFHHKIS
jgi:hypothetical protein